VARALGGAAQTRPHAPQFDGSLDTSAQAPVQRVVPAAQVLLQCPPEQTVPSEQTVPHAPQFVLVVIGVSQPFATRPSQSE
jgi:hypothetical protein